MNLNIGKENEMIHTFKLNGVRAAVDSRDGSVSILDNLSYLMIPEMPENPAAEMPTSLRYALAKYDSKDLAAAYKELYSLFTAEKEAYTADSAASVTAVIYENGVVQKELPAIANTMCLEIRGNPSESELEDIEAVVSTAGGSVKNLLLKAPWRAVKRLSCTNLCSKVIAAVAVNELADANLAENAVIELLFAPSDDLAGCVMELFNKGNSAVSAYPLVSDFTEIAAQYEKLSRDLLRYRKKGGKGVFAPFAFDFYGVGEKGAHLQYDINGNSVADTAKFKGVFTEYYVLSGALAHLTDVLDSVEVINKCVECAICLSAENQ